jgi:uncharacterized membrane protein YfcA
LSSTASRWRAGAAGVITGAAAGLVGVGGGEFRIPVLIRWLRLPHRSLLLVVKVYLILIGTWMVYEALSHTEHALIDPHGAVRLILAGVVALLIAIASGVLVGAAFVPAVGRDLLKGLLGAILLLASVRLTAPVEAEELGR